MPYYRLFNSGLSAHHWTADANEYYTLSLLTGWNGEGVDGYILPTWVAGTVQLYRLYLSPARLHHWTIDANEFKTLILPVNGWIEESGAGFLIE